MPEKKITTVEMAAMRRELKSGYQSIDGASLILRCFPAISTPGLWHGPRQRSSGPCGTLGPDGRAKEAGEGKIGAFANYLVDACYFAGEPQDGVQVGLLDVSLEDMEFQTDWRACGKRNREIQFVEDIYLDESFFVS